MSWLISKELKHAPKVKIINSVYSSLFLLILTEEGKKNLFILLRSFKFDLSFVNTYNDK